MQLSRFLFLVALLLLPMCLFSTTWLYLYPLFHSCGFLIPEGSHSAPTTAPFRLLALGDPQLEGDSSLPKADRPAFPSLRYLKSNLNHAGSWKRKQFLLTKAIRGVVKKDLPKWIEGYRKRVDLWGNDFYLAHIVRQLRWWTQPTHVSVLGDLLGSQWVSDEEFDKRADRYWGRVFKGMERVNDSLMEDNEEGGRKWGGSVQVLGDDKTWENKVINIAGNHDIGYAGDLDENRITRFEKAFGRVNWDLWLEQPRPRRLNSDDEEQQPEEQKEAPALRLVVLNSMNLDTPAYSEDLQRETYDFMNHIITTSRPVTSKTHTTILLTHIPLHKEAGTCVDDPFFDFFDNGAGVKEQNMLSDHASKIMLEGIFGLNGNPEVDGKGLGRKGIIINGHDHEGCDVIHYISDSPFSSEPTPRNSKLQDEGYTTPSNISEPPTWRAIRTPASPSVPLRGLTSQSAGNETPEQAKVIPSIREITLRSMMGDFSGYAGFLSAWFDEQVGEEGEWRVEFNTCGVGVQHWWWAVHIVDLVAVAIITLASFAKVIESILGKTEAARVPSKATGKNFTAIKGAKKGEQKERDGKSS